MYHDKNGKNLNENLLTKIGFFEKTVYRTIRYFLHHKFSGHVASKAKNPFGTLLDPTNIQFYSQ